MGIIVFVVIVALVGLVCLAAAVFGKSMAGGTRAITGGAGAVVLILAGAILLFSSIHTVGTSDVGITTAFGRTVGDLGPGMHLIAPWDGVTTWDGSVQTISYGRDTNQANNDHCLLVHIGGGQSACLAMTFQYQLRLASSDSLFKRYRTQPNMNDKLVVRSLDQAVNTQLATFSPIEATAACKVGTTCLGASLVPYEAKIRTQMIHDIGTDIRVESLFIPFASYNPSLQQRLDQLQTQRVDTLIAQQQIQTNTALATAYGKLAAAVSHDPSVISANCVNNVLIPMVKAGMNPAGVNCPGSGSGSGSTVVVPTK